MKNWFKLGLVLSPVALAAQLLVPGQAAAQDANEQLLEQINNYSQESSSLDSLNQVNSISQLRDVSPGDWAFSALRNLVERYDCLDGYPNRTYRGNRALTRYEFAAGLNACMEQIERLIVTGSTDSGVDASELGQISRLVDEFEAELATLGTRVDNLEGRLGDVEDNQFSTTTKLEGEVVFQVLDSFGSNDPNNTVFEQRTRLNFVSSFTGEDALYVRLDQGNSAFDATADDQGSIISSYGSGGNVELGWLAYYFPIGESIDVYLPAAYPLWQDFMPTVSPYLDSFTGATGALTSFGESSPIYKLGLGEGGGIGANFNLSDEITVSAGYFGAEAPNPATTPASGTGLFNGDNSAAAQLTWTPSDDIQLAATYNRTYSNSGDLFLATGTANANGPFGTNSTVADSFGLAGSVQISDGFNINAFGGITQADESGTAREADIAFYGVGLSFPDLGSEGSLGGIVVGSEPYVTEHTTTALEDDSNLHVEALYKYKVNDNVFITPGVVWIEDGSTAVAGDDVFIGTLRTTFVF